MRTIFGWKKKGAATVEKYLPDVRAFARWLEGREITKERTAAWKTHLVERGYAPPASMPCSPP
ncbi:MAG: hypothetical protein ACLUJG_07815 [Lawsonibacter sp.]